VHKQNAASRPHRGIVLVRRFAAAQGLFLFGTITFCALSAALAASIGSAVVVVNNVTGRVAPVAEGTLLHAGSDVQQDETVETAAASATRLIFQDSTVLEIGPFAQVTLDRLIYDPDPARSQVALSILKGSARFTTGILPKQDYEIRTPTATVTVRGTILVIDVAPNGRTTIYVEKGMASVSGGASTVELHEGQWTIVLLNGAPSAPVTGPNPIPFLGLPVLNAASTNNLFNTVIGITGNAAGNTTSACISPSKPGNRC